MQIAYINDYIIKIVRHVRVVMTVYVRYQSNVVKAAEGIRDLENASARISYRLVLTLLV